MTGKKLTLSIVIPVYNEQDHLPACLKAIAAQSVKPDQVIVVNNNSTDTSVNIARSFPFVTVLHEPKQGIVYARNRGFNRVSSDLIARIDADTILPPDWTHQVLREYAGKPNFALTGGGYFYNVHFSKINGWLQGQIAFRFNRLIMGHYILWGSNMVVPRSKWRSVEGMLCQRTDIHEDLDLAIHLQAIGCPIVYREHLRVGVYMKRVFDRYTTLWSNLMMWPRTLRAHHMNRAVFGFVGALTLMVLSPFLIALETGIRLIDRIPNRRQG